MEELLNTTMYGPDIATKIESTGAMGVSIANRWMLGWPGRVHALLVVGDYIEQLVAQVELEKEILANEPNLRHLAPREVLALYEIKESPPAVKDHAAVP